MDYDSALATFEALVKQTGANHVIVESLREWGRVMVCRLAFAEGQLRGIQQVHERMEKHACEGPPGFSLPPAWNWDKNPPRPFRPDEAVPTGEPD